MPDLDPFQVLGLTRDATPEQVEAAYRKRADLADQARAAAGSDDDRARIEHQKRLLAGAYELASELAYGRASLRTRPSSAGDVGPSSAPPRALVLSIVLGVAGVVALVAAASTGAHGLYTAVVVLGASSLLSALYWRHQLVLGWAQRRRRED